MLRIVPRDLSLRPASPLLRIASDLSLRPASPLLRIVPRDLSLRPASPLLRIASGLLLLLAACNPQPPGPAATPTPAPTPAPAVDVEAAAEARRQAELPHQIVFADRITYSYVLLLPGADLSAPTRAELDAAVREAFPRNLGDEEVELLRGLIARPIDEAPIAPGAAAQPEEDPESAQGAADGEARRASDLLGLSIEVHPRVPTSGPPLIEPRVLDDPDLARALEPAELASIPTRNTLLVLRAQYRNQHGVRGLRLLQTLVRVIATRRGALIHDPDTLETLSPAVFAARRLQTSLGNVADQIPIIPFADPLYPGKFRLTTRGMRRFGSVDLELGALPGDLSVLQQGTYFLHGLARQMIDLGEFDRSGFAVELPDILTLHYSDCAAAYAGHPGSLPRCTDCPERVDLHLVERAAEPHDAVAHVVARIVAPRSRSDRGDYDAAAWAQEALDHVLGRPPM